MTTEETAGDAAEETADVVVVGGGQAGLAMAYHLGRHRCSAVVLEAEERLGQQWRSRWDSLRLFTPARYAHLPGAASPGARWSYPTKDDVAAHLETYAQEHHLPVRLGVTVRRVRRHDGGFLVETTHGAWRARNVVVATGPFQVPVVPAATAGLSFDVLQLHSSDYRRPGQLPPGRVLVVGGGSSGFQIALELARDGGHEVHLSRGERRTISVPQRILGRDIFWWQQVLGVLDIPATSRFGRHMRAHDRTVVGVTPRQLRRAGVRLHGRTRDAEGRAVRFDDGSAVEVDSVVWATGFRTDHSWIDVPEVFDGEGSPVHDRGATAVPGLYFLGLAWLHTTGSALLGFVGRDAAHLAGLIAGRCHDSLPSS